VLYSDGFADLFCGTYDEYDAAVKQLRVSSSFEKDNALMHHLFLIRVPLAHVIAPETLLGGAHLAATLA
jgi:hypothetical protein